MGETYVGSQGAVANAALWRGKRQTGGALVVAGAATWLVHSILMIVGLVALFSGSLADADAVAQSVTGVFVTFVLATVAVLLATFLLGAGLLLYQGGTAGLSWQDPTTGGRHVISTGTRAKGNAAAALVIAYGALGVVVIAIYAMMLLNPVTDLLGLLTRIVAILVLWIVASIVLVAAGALVSSFLNALRMEAASMQSFSGTGFLGYSIANAIGVFLLAGSLLLFLWDPASASLDLRVPISIGGVMELLAVPIIGIVVFGLLIGHGLQLRRLEPAPRGIPVYTAPGMRPTPYYSRPPAYPNPPPAPSYAVPAVATTMLPSPANPAPPPPPPARAPVVDPPPPREAPPPPVGGESWVLRLEARIEGLERAMKEQKDFLFRIERSLVDARIDNSADSDTLEDQRERIAELEREIAETRARLEAKPGDAKAEPSSDSQDPLDEF